jgi:ribonuclease Z
LNEVAEALGVPQGPERRELVHGRSVTLADGRVIHPDQVLGPPRPGAKLVHVGDAARTEDIVPHARDADALVIEATYLSYEADLARQFGHLTASQSAQLARDANVRELYLTHISRRYREQDVLAEAQAIFPQTHVARDLDHIRITKPKS